MYTDTEPKGIYPLIRGSIGTSGKAVAKVSCPGKATGTAFFEDYWLNFQLTYFLLVLCIFVRCFAKLLNVHKVSMMIVGFSEVHKLQAPLHS